MIGVHALVCYASYQLQCLQCQCSLQVEGGCNQGGISKQSHLLSPHQQITCQLNMLTCYLTNLLLQLFWRHAKKNGCRAQSYFGGVLKSLGNLVRICIHFEAGGWRAGGWRHLIKLESGCKQGCRAKQSTEQQQSSDIQSSQQQQQRAGAGRRGIKARGAFMR